MKIFILILFISLQARATTFGKYRSVPEGVDAQTFVATESDRHFEKTSNLFDPTGNDYSIGTFSLASGAAEFTTLMKRVEEFSAKFKTVDDFLKTKDSSFNEVSGNSGHEVVILVNDFKVRPSSKYYKELDELFQKLRSLSWTQTKGFKVSENLKILEEFDGGKVIKTQPYAREMYCRNMQMPTVCTFHGGGEIYVK
jgi:hypothetical protein